MVNDHEADITNVVLLSLAGHRPESCTETQKCDNFARNSVYFVFVRGLDQVSDQTGLTFITVLVVIRFIDI